MTQPPKVLHVIDTLGMGGAETWLMEVLRLWATTGAARMEFLITSGQRGLFDDEAKALGAKIHYIRYGRAGIWTFARKFRKLLRDGLYDAIHDHQDYIAGWHFLFGLGLLPRVRVAHVHNPAYQIRNNYGVSNARRLTSKVGKALLARYATHIAGTSRQVIREYGFDQSIFSHIPRDPLHCGVNTSRFLADREMARASLTAEFAWPADALIALFVGRIDVSPDSNHPQAHKNAGFAVDVAIAAARQNSRFRLVLAGKESPAVPLLQARVSRASLENRIIFTGVRQDVERLMAAADVLLFPSRGEGLGMVAVEAQAAGLPVLASSTVPAECVVVPELVRFLDLASGPQAWADELTNMARLPRRVTAANRQVAASAFSIETSAKAMIDLYGTCHLS